MLNSWIFRFIRTAKPWRVLEQPQLILISTCNASFAAINKSFGKNTNLSLPKVKELVTNMANRKWSNDVKRTLYKMDQSPPSRAVMMVIDLLGLDVKLEDLNPVPGVREQDQPEFVKANPMRTIPIFQEGDFGLGDSHAIMIYLLDKYGKATHEPLYPKDPRKRAVINQVLFFECGLLFPRLRAIMAPTYRGKLTELTKYMKVNIEDAYGMIEHYLCERDFLADDVMTIADLSVYTTVQTLDTMHPADAKRFPKFKRWFETMSGLDVVKHMNETRGGNIHGVGLLTLMEINKENQLKKAKL